MTEPDPRVWGTRTAPRFRKSGSYRSPSDAPRETSPCGPGWHRKSGPVGSGFESLRARSCHCAAMDFSYNAAPLARTLTATAMREPGLHGAGPPAGAFLWQPGSSVRCRPLVPGSSQVPDARPGGDGRGTSHSVGKPGSTRGSQCRWTSSRRSRQDDAHGDRKERPPVWPAPPRSCDGTERSPSPFSPSRSTSSRLPWLCRTWRRIWTPAPRTCSGRSAPT